MFLPESPRFSLELKRYDELKTTLEFIAWMNGQPYMWDPTLFENEETAPLKGMDGL